MDFKQLSESDQDYLLECLIRAVIICQPDDLRQFKRQYLADLEEFSQNFPDEPDIAINKFEENLGKLLFIC